MAKALIGEIMGFPVNKFKYKLCKDFPTYENVGIEIEIEDSDYRKIDRDVYTYWKVETDGSLRNGGREFKTVGPLFGLDIEEALNSYGKWIKNTTEENGPIEHSYRESVHIHLDVRDLSQDEVLKLISVYLSVEKLLFHVSGKRNNSIYCVPLTDTYDSLHAYCNPCADSKLNLAKKYKISHYAALNTSPIVRFGTIEFRHHEGTEDIQKIKDWIKIIIGLKTYVKTTEIDLTDFPLHVSKTGIVDYIKQLFGDMWERFTYEGFHIDLMEGLRYAQNTINKQLIDKETSKLFGDSIMDKKFIDKYRNPV